MAKYLAAKASWEAANACLQFHGGFGFAARIRRRAQVPRDAALPGGADLDQPDPLRTSPSTCSACRARTERDASKRWSSRMTTDKMLQGKVVVVTGAGARHRPRPGAGDGARRRARGGQRRRRRRATQVVAEIRERRRRGAGQRRQRGRSGRGAAHRRRARSTPSAASTASSTTPASCATASSTR